MAKPPSQTDAARPAPHAIILAAGKGKRMGGDLPKVLHEVAGKPMLHWVIQACRAAGVEQCVLVIGHRGELVREAFADAPGCLFVEQHEQLGTGHAAQMAQPLYENTPPRDLFVLAGDGPLIRAATLEKLLQAHRSTNAAMSMATAVLDDPTGYGRVVRDAQGNFQQIVEQKDATPEQLAIREVNPSYYCLRGDVLFDALPKLRNENASGEYYITDVPAILQREAKTVTVVDAVPPEDVLSINTAEQLKKVETVFLQRQEKDASLTANAKENG